jgi:hypothetical protein
MLTQNLPNSVAAAIIAENDRLRKASVEILLETLALQEKLGSGYSEPALGRIGSGANGWPGQPPVTSMAFQAAAINSGVTRGAL